MPRQRAAGVRASIPLTPIPIAAAKTDSPKETATSTSATMGNGTGHLLFADVPSPRLARFTRSRPGGSPHGSGLEHADQDDD
jgi:hypothetical protein